MTTLSYISCICMYVNIIYFLIKLIYRYKSILILKAFTFMFKITSLFDFIFLLGLVLIITCCYNDWRMHMQFHTVVSSWVSHSSHLSHGSRVQTSYNCCCHTPDPLCNPCCWSFQCLHSHSHSHPLLKYWKYFFGCPKLRIYLEASAFLTFSTWFLYWTASSGSKVSATTSLTRRTLHGNVRIGISHSHLLNLVWILTTIISLMIVGSKLLTVVTPTHQVTCTTRWFH